MVPGIVSQGTGAGYTTIPYHWSVSLFYFLRPLLIILYQSVLGMAWCPGSCTVFLAHVDSLALLGI